MGSNNFDVTNILQRLDFLESSYVSLKDDFNELTLSHTRKVKEIKELKKINEGLQEQLEDLEVGLAELDQYGRRESIEILNISESVAEGKELEKYVIDFVNTTFELKLSSYDIVAVHRLGKKRRPNQNRRVVCRFINRKNSYYCKGYKNKAKREAKYKKLFVVESLCFYNKSIFNRLYKLKKNNEIEDVWTRNGCIWAVFMEGDEPVQIRHKSDVDFFLADDTYDPQYDSDENENQDEDDSDKVPFEKTYDPKQNKKDKNSTVTIRSTSNVSPSKHVPDNTFSSIDTEKEQTKDHSVSKELNAEMDGDSELVEKTLNESRGSMSKLKSFFTPRSSGRKLPKIKV